MAAADDLKIANQAQLDAEKVADAAFAELGAITPSSPKYAALKKKYEDALGKYKKLKGKYDDLKEIADDAAKKTKTEEAAKTSEIKQIEEFVKSVEKGYSSALEAYKKDPTNTGKANSYQNFSTQLNNAYNDAEQQGLTFDRLVVQSKAGDIVPATQAVTVNPAATGDYSPGVPNSAFVVKSATGEALTRQQRGENVTATPTGAVAGGGTGAGGGAGGGAGVSGKPGKPGKDTKPVDTSWEPLFKQNYPQYNWMFTDLDRTKYADVFDLFKRAQQNKMLPEEFDRQYIGTSFYRELQSSKKGRELSAAIGNFTWGSGNLAKFLTKATQYGYEGENLKQQAYKELFTKVDNKYVNDLAVKEVRASTPYLGLKDIGKQYFVDFADSQIEQVLSGAPNFDGVAVSRDDLIRKARLAAKARFGHLSEQIDGGLTLEDLSASYKEKAAKLLELDPNTINFGTDFSEALDYRKDGQPRVLSLGEWETELRTNDKYKYSFTKQANQDATDIGLAIARAFGKVQ